MPNDIPYSRLKENERDFAILTLRDQHNSAFREIAAKFNISSIRARQVYNNIKLQQLHLYINHLSVALGHPNTAQFQKELRLAYACYREFSCVCAYFEKKYKEILDEYRAGEPGLPARYLKRLPPLRRLNERTISRIVKMREEQGATFLIIAKELRITPERAKHAYDNFYSLKVMARVSQLQKQTTDPDEQRAIWQHYFNNSRSSKTRYEMMLAEEEQ